jgi:hypothetical protein
MELAPERRSDAAMLPDPLASVAGRPNKKVFTGDPANFFNVRAPA